MDRSIVLACGGAPITNGGVPLAGGSTLVVQVTGTAVGGVSVPAGAKAVIANLTALPFTRGDLTIWADGLPRPNASNLNYTPGINIANFVMSALSASGKADIYAHVGTTNVILDVAGFIV
ncbi:MAG TPA: hypothetical protein VF818_00740 [Ktedonobacterales bacterium]